MEEKAVGRLLLWLSEQSYTATEKRDQLPTITAREKYLLLCLSLYPTSTKVGTSPA
jgi:hypothetical protein